MEGTRRRILSEAHTTSGAIVDEMKSYSLTPVENDGINIYGNVRINPITSGPFSNSQEISIPITSTNFDVIEFSNSYLHILARLRIRIANPPKVDEATDEEFAKVLKQNQYVMLGLKCGTHVIRDYQVKHDNIPITTTMQTAIIRTIIKSEWEQYNGNEDDAFECEDTSPWRTPSAVSTFPLEILRVEPSTRTLTSSYHSVNSSC